MADDDAPENGEDAPRKKRGGMLIGLVLALAGGGGAFGYTSGMIGGSGKSDHTAYTAISDDLAFVPLDSITVAIGAQDDRRHLRFRAELEVNEEAAEDVGKLLPRVADVLNTYLQSLTVAEIEDPKALLTIRSQMRRRVDLVVGGDRVHDLLVLEFVVN